MTTTHTPGPWTIHPQGEANHYAVILDGGKWLAALQFNGELMEAKQLANAKLIAAAPDLLAVLQELQGSAAYWSEYDVPLGITDRIQAALAKATGEQA
ncbi:MAG: hypothetical protein RL442_48 [Pseudomonadota bacterium]|jgi:hypothetical protein